jgi:hypothetical protein
LEFGQSVIGSDFFDRHLVVVDRGRGKVMLRRNP